MLEFQENVSSIVNPANTSTNVLTKPGWFEAPQDWMKDVVVSNEKAREFTVNAVEKISAWVLEQLKKVISFMPQMALASMVLPVPIGPPVPRVPRG